MWCCSGGRKYRREPAMRNSVYAVVGFVLLVLGSAVSGDEKKIPLSEVPKAVIDGVKARFPDAELKEAQKEIDDDETLFEISLTTAGKHVTVSASDEGEIEEIETEITAGELPKAVAEAIAAKFAEATVKKAEELIEIDDGKEEKSYEVQLATPGAETREVKLKANGEIEDTEEDEFTNDFAAEKADLTSIGRNPYFILEPGYQLVLEGGEEKLTITVLDETKVIDDVETRVVEERETKSGKLAEVSRNYIAISKRTNSVYYFGEDVDEYKDGKQTGHGGSWMAGSGNARFGLLIPGQPLLGAKYAQELAPGKAMDRAEVVELDAVMLTPAGQFKNCLKTEETSPLEPASKEYKHYAPGIGLVQDGSLKLVRYGKVK
jgi:Putative beta-lactamase-inhibitor-like, PepSY-like